MKTQSSNKKAIIIAIAVSVVLITLAAVAVTENEKKAKIEEAVTYNTAKQELHAEYKKAFMEGCTEDNTMYKECNCMLTYMEARIGMDNLIDESIRYKKTGKFSPVMTEAVNACYLPMNFLIWSNEEQGWMRPKVNGLAGWTSMKSLAGKFTLEEAVEICKEENLDVDFTPTKQDPLFIIVPNVTMFPDQENEYDDGQGRKYDILDEELQ